MYFKKIHFFTAAGIDKDVFFTIDECMLNDIFYKSKCGFTWKFIKYFNAWKKDENHLSPTKILSHVTPH